MNAYTNLAWKSKNLKTNTLILVLILKVKNINITDLLNNKGFWKTIALY